MRTMRTWVRTWAVVGVLGAAAALPAKAEDAPFRFYVAMNAGISVTPTTASTTIVQSGTGDAAIGTFSFSGAPAGGGSVGIAIGHLRVEEEINYRSVGISNFTSEGIVFDTVGHFDALAFMTNVFYDFHMTERSAINIGVGVGIAHLTNYSNITYQGQSCFHTNDSNDVFAYQAMGGVSYDITDDVTLGIMYRYFATTGGTFVTNLVGFGPGTVSNGIVAHEFLGTARYGF